MAMAHRLIIFAFLLIIPPAASGQEAAPERRSAPLDFVQVSEDNTSFVLQESGRKFVPWGFNYDHDGPDRLIEDYWDDEWPMIVEDFREMKELGATVVRIHLQFGKFMDSPDDPNQHSLHQLARLVALAEQVGLYLDLTGLGCYHKQDVPPWYDKLEEQERWAAQAAFWKAVAKTCAKSPAVFYTQTNCGCYDCSFEELQLFLSDGGPRALGLPKARMPPLQKLRWWTVGELGC